MEYEPSTKCFKLQTDSILLLLQVSGGDTLCPILKEMVFAIDILAFRMQN